MTNDELILSTDLESFKNFLYEQEKARGTISKYTKDISDFKSEYRALCDDNTMTSKQKLVKWKESLNNSNYLPSTINGKISSVNTYLKFLGLKDLSLSHLKIQHKIYRDKNRILYKEEYYKLLKASKVISNKIELIIETICSTGIRISELNYITIEAIKANKAVVNLKGKNRIVLIPRQLSSKLLIYANKNGIETGQIFVGNNGQPISRQMVWYYMKNSAKIAGIDSNKVFPHNLRHLFAVTYYDVNNDITKLADILGHSSIETTRIYLSMSGEDHLRSIEQLDLIVD